MPGPSLLPGTTLWITEAEVVAAVDLTEAIDALAEGFGAEGAGRAAPLEKTMLAFGGQGTLHALGAAGDDLLATKTWAHTPGGAAPILVLFDAATGSLVAVIEAFALGQLRTAGTAALATDRLARADAGRLAIIGTGKQALAQVAAVNAVRELIEVRAFSRDQARREAFARKVTEQLGLSCRPCATAAEAVEGADVVTLVTRATEPVLTDSMVVPGVHVNAVGAIDLARQELEPALLGRAGIVVTDSLTQARNLSAELRSYYGAGVEPWPGLRTLGEVVRQGIRRSGAGEVTLFKGMGSGIADLAVGAEVLARVRKAGGGREITPSERVVPNLARRSTKKAGCQQP